MKLHHSSLRFAVHPIVNLRRRGVEVVDADLGRLLNVFDPPAASRAAIKSLMTSVLSIDGNRTASSQSAHLDAMATAAEAQLDAVMGQSQAPQPLSDAGLIE